MKHFTAFLDLLETIVHSIVSFMTSNESPFTSVCLASFWWEKIFLLFNGSLKEHLVSQITSTQKYSKKKTKKSQEKNMKNFYFG